MSDLGYPWDSFPQKSSDFDVCLMEHKRALDRIEKLKKTVRELQMADPMLEFISRVQDAGLHEEWNDFNDKLHDVEKENRERDAHETRHYYD